MYFDHVVLLALWQAIRMKAFSCISMITPNPPRKSKSDHPNVFEDSSRDSSTAIWNQMRIKIPCTYPRISSNKLSVSPEVVQHRYGYLSKGSSASDRVIVRGRVSSFRASSSKLYFLDINSDGHKIQTVASPTFMKSSEYPSDSWNKLKECVRDAGKGDIIEVHGHPGRTERGELSIYATEVVSLSKCLHRIPEILEDTEKRLRTRHLDLLVNPSSGALLRQRSLVVKTIREFLGSRGFIEVETPVLQSSASGAMARPFKTTSILGFDLQLRIAPELALKKAIVGGFDRVYEIGKCFRNEGVSVRHNPEFTTCEFYQAYASLEDLIDTTEHMLQELEIKATGKIELFHSFKRIDFIPALEREMGQPLPDCREKLLSLLSEMCMPVDSNLSIAEMYDLLAARFLEPLCIGPTFLMNHPVQLCPLSKSTGKVSHRFELFVGGMELVNAYEEENDPSEQRRKFLEQSKSRRPVDLVNPKHQAEIGLTHDEKEFCDVLEYALPPTGGWGIGIDRLCMLLGRVGRINEVLLGGGIKYQIHQLSKKSLRESTFPSEGFRNQPAMQHLV